MSKTYIVEHLDPELGPWSALEYKAITKESAEAGSTFCLSCVPKSLVLPNDLLHEPGFSVEQRGVEELYADRKGKVWLLEPAAKVELSPEDGERFDVFLFGGILGQFS